MQNARFSKIRDFFTLTIWSPDINEASFILRAISNTVKVVAIAVRRFIDDRIIRRAADLTYSTLFAIIPILALIFAVARGFGFENIVEELLNKGIIGQNETVDTIMAFIDSYLKFTHNGLFVGIGLLILLWSVFALANGIEVNLNFIWKLKKTRKVTRKITDYFSLLLLIPIAIICLSGLSVLASGILTRTSGYQLLGGFVKFLIQAMPYLLAGFIFTGFYMFMPNTKVRFKYAVIPGFFAGLLFQLFQNLYFHSQLMLSNYNAIYGGFAALPLFMLWCNISWAIVLFGCELSFVSQNNDFFNNYSEPERFSRYHDDFYSLLVLNLIARRFADIQSPLTAQQIARELHIPLRTAFRSIYSLIDAGLLESTSSGQNQIEATYLPASDIGQMTVAKVLARLNSSGFSNYDFPDKSGHAYKTLKQLEDYRTNMSGDIWDTPIANL